MLPAPPEFPAVNDFTAGRKRRQVLNTRDQRRAVCPQALTVSRQTVGVVRAAATVPGARVLGRPPQPVIMSLDKFLFLR